jgi:hypothetical protein
MIQTHYTPGSRLGNHMMQYSSLYALSKHLNYHLSLPPIEGFCNTQKSDDTGLIFNTPSAPYILKARHYLNRDAISPQIKKTITGHDCCYLENIFNFDEYRKDLVRIFSYPSFDLSDYTFFKGKTSDPIRTKVTRISPRDIVISLRIGDFVYTPNATSRWVKCVYSRFLGFDYFDIILKGMRFNRLFITSDEPLHPLVDAFQKYDPIMVQNDSAIKTLAFIKRFDRIAIAESTYSWWAAYLTEASEIYYPISKNGLWGINMRWNPTSSKWRLLNKINDRDSDLYLRVNNDRYKYVHQESGIIYTYRDAPGKRDRKDFI